MIQRLFLALLLGLSLLAGPALAVAPDEVLDDPVLESRARALSSELRCMVCQNQSIDDSDAPLAKDLRILDSDEQVVDYLVSRYGEFVLLKPRFAWHTIVLWAAGPVALIAGLIAIGAALRKRARNRSASTDTSTSTLTADEERRLQALLDKAD